MRTTPDDPGPAAEPPPEELHQARTERLLKAWRPPTGWRRLSAVNNTDVGYWYTSGAFLFFLFAGVLALIMRTQLAVPENDLISADRYNQLFTMHGSIMMFLFAVPLFEAFSIMVLPEVQGSRELPFPKLSAFGFWCFAIGGVFVCGSLFFDAGAKGGWFMYPPLSTAYQPGIGNDVWLLGLSFIEIASIAAAVELIVGVLRCRPPGMRINLIPLYSWYVLVVGGMILFAFPPLIAGDILLELERLLDWPFFDPTRGGDPVLWQHLFWIFGHPEVYIVFLPSIALVAMMVPTYAQTPIVGYSWIVLAAVGTGFLSFGLWVHHMYTVGLPGISLGLFSAASEAVAIPTGVQIFCFLATLLAGQVQFRVPVLFVLGGMATFILGGLTGVMIALVPFDLQAHDSYFIVAHLHSVLIGGVLFPVVAAFYYFFPLVNGKKLSERLGHVVFWLMFLDFNVTFVPMHLTGLLGMPRRVYTYEGGLGFDEKDAGLGLVLPLYRSGSDSVGWWGMLVAMLGDMTAFIALVFGYFFYWTVHEDFPPSQLPDPDPITGLALALLLASWALTARSRQWNRNDRVGAFYGGLGLAAALAVGGTVALIAACSAMEPTVHAYPAIVAVLVMWTALHVAVGVIMQLFCLAARLAGRMTGKYDIYIHNVALYWHFVAVTVLITVLVVAGFPLLS